MARCGAIRSEKGPQNLRVKRVGLARALSKLGYCSRSQAVELIHAGRVRLNGAMRRDQIGKRSPKFACETCWARSGTFEVGLLLAIAGGRTDSRGARSSEWRDAARSDRKKVPKICV